MSTLIAAVFSAAATAFLILTQRVGIIYNKLPRKVTKEVPKCSEHISLKNVSGPRNTVSAKECHRKVAVRFSPAAARGAEKNSLRDGLCRELKLIFRAGDNRPMAV